MLVARVAAISKTYNVINSNHRDAGRRVCLLGADLENPNRGVQALAFALIQNLVAADPKASVCMIYGSRSGGRYRLPVNGGVAEVEVLNYRLSPKASLQEHLLWLAFLAFLYWLLPFSALRKRLLTSNARLRALATSDLVGDICGGDSFSDIYGARNFIVGSIPALATILVRGNLVLLPQTLGPFKSRAALQLARFILARARRVCVRDQESLDMARRLLPDEISRKRAVLCPDVAFTLPAVRPQPVAIDPPLPAKRAGLLVGLNISALLYIGGYTEDNMFGLRLNYAEFVLQLIRALIAGTDARILLVPHHFGPPGIKHSDLTSSREVLAALSDSERQRVHLVTAEYNAREIKGIIGMCDLFVGSRMHACIAAVSQGVPTVAVAYSRKFIGVFDSIGAGKMVLDGRSVNNDQAIARILDLCARLPEPEHGGGDEVQHARLQVSALLREMLSSGSDFPVSAPAAVHVPLRSSLL